MSVEHLPMNIYYGELQFENQKNCYNDTIKPSLQISACNLMLGKKVQLELKLRGLIGEGARHLWNKYNTGKQKHAKSAKS